MVINNPATPVVKTTNFVFSSLQTEHSGWASGFAFCVLTKGLGRSVPPPMVMVEVTYRKWWYPNLQELGSRNHCSDESIPGEAQISIDLRSE